MIFTYFTHRYNLDTLRSIADRVRFARAVGYAASYKIEKISSFEDLLNL